ncbi:oxidoreductase [Mollisia scopiformis]|uniref:Oxidoreductase n=1 Tax=Mollisia scopiformis TaxID=149040 RepID=A0A194X1G1_MOLSC|nr:oxidoreductase [Mollisia scopiformis]KUJ14035.1 oxidoreductase [Mollisia scopiformis]
MIDSTSRSTTTSPPLNIILIGAGLIGPRHAESILKNPFTTLLALIDPSPATISLAATLTTTHYPSIPSFLSSSPQKADAAIICTPNSTHVSLALELISASIPLLVEKPISTTISDGKKLIDSAKEKDIKILISHHRRFNPYLIATKKCLDDKQLGTITAIQGTWSLLKTPSYFTGPGSWRQSSASGGVVLINLIHEIDLLQFLLGPITWVTALPTPKTRGFEAEEGAAILLKFESGVVGTFILSDATPSPWNFEMGTGENPLIGQVEGSEVGGFYRIFGTGGSLSVPDLRVWRGDWWEGMEREEVRVEREKVPFDEQLGHFVNVVRGAEEPGCSGEEGLRALVVCEAVKRSMGEGRAVEIKGFEIRCV